MNRLFEPIKIGKVELKNRIIFPPMTTGFEQGGVITDQSINFYTSLAKGGAALIVLGDAAVDTTFIPVPGISDDKFIPMLKKLTDAVHANGALISPQLFHQEFYAAELMKVPREQFAAKMKDDMENFASRLSHTQIEEIIKEFADGAKRAVQAGFDMVQIHGDRLVGQFSSPILNKRTDEYGGSIENRAKFALAVVTRIREVVGEDFPIDYKFCIIRPDEGKAGPTLEEAKKMAPWLVEAGVNSFHVSLANHSGFHQTIPPMGFKPFGCFLDLAEGIKKAVDVPVSAVGRIVSPELAESILAEGKADIISLGRALVADPEWPIKVKEGRYDDIRKCMMCNQGCTDRLMARQCISCSINAAVGKEAESVITKAATVKKVFIAGGGPAGMEAARVASLRGHRVTLVEKSDKLGGQISMAAVPEHKKELVSILEYLSVQLKKLSVTIYLNKEATADMIAEENPDVVVIATGAQPLIPDLNGTNTEKVKTAWDILSGKSTAGENVIVIGGGSVGSETAAHLAESGKKVVIVEMLEKICADMSMTIMPYFMRLIKEQEINVYTKHRLDAVTSNGVVVKDENNEKKTIEADTVVMAVGAVPENMLENQLEDKGMEVYSIGDCSSAGPRKIIDAVHDAYFTMLKV
jgi:2,4-dienoyl-CoA reductase-like NADH-dependent reductase (Old Yellow Enzyme family)/thioredoxin reductase